MGDKLKEKLPQSVFVKMCEKMSPQDWETIIEHN